MFEQKKNNNQVEDIFAEIDKTEPEVSVKMAEPTYYIEESRPKPIETQKRDRFNFQFNLKTSIIIIALIVLLFVIGLAVYLRLVNKNDLANDTLMTDNETSKSDTTTPVNTAEEEKTESDGGLFDFGDDDNSNVEVNEFSIDSDGDGLSDEAERTYGTNSNKADTDNDGLFDGEEISFYKTDPLNPDSDGDSYLDGEEVKAGFDPLGPGRLLNFEAELKKIQNQ